jgi:hypothetical protein
VGKAVPFFLVVLVPVFLIAAMMINVLFNATRITISGARQLAGIVSTGTGASHVSSRR